MGRIARRYLMGERGFRAGFRTIAPGPWALFGLGLLTYLLIDVTWVFFRPKTLPRAWHVLAAWRAATPMRQPILPTVFLAAVAAIMSRRLVAATGTMRERTLESVVARAPPVLIGADLGLDGVHDRHIAGTGNAFIYFQF